MEGWTKPLLEAFEIEARLFARACCTWQSKYFSSLFLLSRKLKHARFVRASRWLEQDFMYVCAGPLKATRSLWAACSLPELATWALALRRAASLKACVSSVRHRIALLDLSAI
jgi:hypothetical protein